jgi:hypothetical protein
MALFRASVEASENAAGWAVSTRTAAFRSDAAAGTTSAGAVSMVETTVRRERKPLMRYLL